MAPLVCLTGATGFVGFQVLLHALESFRVRCVVRDDKKKESLLRQPALAALQLPPGQLTFVLVPDFTARGAFKEAVEDCDYIIHVASAIAANLLDEDPARCEELLIQPAVKGTLEMLEAAEQAGTVSRVVITSSAVASVPYDIWQGNAPPGGARFGPDSRNPMKTAGPFESIVDAYIASKTAALKETEAWMAARARTFDVVNIHPGFVFGADAMAASKDDVNHGTDALLLNPLLGGQGFAIAGSCCHVNDVSRLHVLALTAAVPGLAKGGCKSLPVSVRVDNFDSAIEIARERFPDAVGSGALPLGGSQPALPGIEIDSSISEQVLGAPLISYEQQVVDVVEQLFAMPD